MKKLLVLLSLVAAPVMAAPPYDVWFTMPATPNATSCKAYIRVEATAQEVDMGEAACDVAYFLPAALPVDGQYSFWYVGVNAAGESNPSPETTITVSEVPLPGDPTQHPQIQIDCAPCVITVDIP